MINLYLFKCTNHILTHLLQHCFVLGRSDLYDPCQPIIKQDLLDWKLGQFVESVNNVEPFRSIDWNNYINELDFLVANNLVRTVGTYRDDQVVFLRKYLGNRVQVVNIIYTEKDYEFMLDFFVRVHIHKQNIGLTPISDTDCSIRNSGINLIEYYKQAFNQSNLIPMSIANTGDYNIPVLDFFTKESFIKHLISIGGNDTQEVRNFYHQWKENCINILATPGSSDVGLQIDA